MSQHAVRTEVRRRELEVETDRYLAELATELGGPPSAEELAEADAWIDDALGTTVSGSPPRSPGPGSRRPAPRRRRSSG
ncbi:MAG: hypothetical protein ACRD0Q_09435 [Acidimicrobiales bacterium]